VDPLILAELILLLIHWAGAAAGLFAFVHALMQRSDAFTAVDRKTKPIWLAITGGGTAAMALFGLGAGGLFWIAGLVAVLVYIVDVRPRVTEVQKGGRNW
jgi:hypothetical protein